jgi:hypothetical protein
MLMPQNSFLDSKLKPNITKREFVEQLQRESYVICFIYIKPCKIFGSRGDYPWLPKISSPPLELVFELKEVQDYPILIHSTKRKTSRSVLSFFFFEKKNLLFYFKQK